MPPGDGPLVAAAVRTVRRSKRCRRPATRPGHKRRAVQHFLPLFPASKKFSQALSFPAACSVYSTPKPTYRRDVMKNVFVAACVAALATIATGAYAQNDAMSKDGMSMSKDAMGHDAMAKDGAMKKDGMKKHAMKKDAMGHDAMKKGDAMKKDAMSPSN
jgi:pentapeptide MXKDX repeat protein